MEVKLKYIYYISTMASLQNQYNLIKEGKGNKEIFLKEARSLFPQYVTNSQTFEEAVNALTSRNIISETLIDPVNVKKESTDWTKIFKENISATLKQTDKGVEELETRGYDYKDTKNIDNLDMNQMLAGYYAEMQKEENADKTEDQLEDIVIKNLLKDPYHYIKHGAFGMSIGYEEATPTKEVTGKFKSSGMEPVKLSEGKERLMEAAKEIAQARLLEEAKKSKFLKKLKELEKTSEVAALHHKITEIDTLIDGLNKKLTMSEGDDVKDMVNKSAVKEMKRDIKLLEKHKAKCMRELAKKASKAGVENPLKQEEKDVVMDEGTAAPDAPAAEHPHSVASAPNAFASMKRDVAAPVKPWNSMVKDILGSKIKK